MPSTQRNRFAVDGAAGYFTFDTRTLPNGIYPISVIVRDNAGHAAGMGSRYITVAN